MNLLNAENALLDIGKLRGYCLNSAHSKGKDKARVFMSALGVRQADALWLRAEILRTLPFAAAVQQIEDVWGIRYAVDMEITHNAKTAIVRTIWIILRGDDRPRFVTCRVV
jgi:hypothetical protein